MAGRNAIIRCPIHGSISLDQREIDLINSPFFQRLRSISQLGFTSLVFPGAVHTRFSHSIGAMHLAGRIFDQVLENDAESLRPYYSEDQLSYFRQIIRFCALLHDVGHAPYSHAAEGIMPNRSALNLPEFLIEAEDRQATHEDFSHAIIYYLAEIEGLLSNEEAIDVIGILSKNNVHTDRFESRSGLPLIYPLLCQIINGEIDVDRMDYLLRDSYYAGVPYGKFDLDRLVSSFSCSHSEMLNQVLLTIEGEGVPSYEIFLLARVHMFYQIYFHKSLGAYRYYLIKAFEENEIENTLDGSLNNFLYLTETGLMEEFKRQRREKWSGKIFNRIPAKNIIRVLDGEKERLQKLQKVKRILQDQGFEVIDSHSSNSYSSQIKGGKIDRETILVRDEEFGKQRIVPLAEKSSLLGETAKMIEINQLYVHREDFDDAIACIQQHL